MMSISNVKLRFLLPTTAGSTFRGSLSSKHLFIFENKIEKIKKYFLLGVYIKKSIAAVKITLFSHRAITK